jgi:hypothetical protein
LWSNRCAKAIIASDAVESPRRIDVAGFGFHILIALIERHGHATLGCDWSTRRLVTRGRRDRGGLAGCATEARKYQAFM